ncbi:MAG: PAS domain-containing sensor histidine kinase [Candidatus Margulisbacteria bacterium]|nr:PAS domain-containing sensor histidine kinase [Candidatus Margulisiibacteriota bacterium]MBU1022259.1 PAS domain-containing sensor histidine kinase [Candidatus Margulisiibacteriota bacterium]MBU1729302.1 PAS domain-containing sensor histidine kinase [Candidatus Margulisiibacteriota bacterium]MBU1955575.1 PAS domain-containing sensor histidine kinase [Candidatus Margulisiibacteriota bacterium]
MQNGKYFKENQEFVEVFQPLDRITRFMMAPLLLVVSLIAAYYGVPYPLKQVLTIFIIYALYTAITSWMIKKGYLPAHIAFFCRLLVSCIIVAAFTYYTGGPASFMPIVYVVVSMLAALTLPFWGFLGVLTMSSLCYLVELGLEVYGFLPQVIIFKEFVPRELYLQSNYLRIVTPVEFIVAISISVLAYNVASLLREREKKLTVLNAQLMVRDQIITAAQENLRKLITNSIDGIVVVDEKGVVRFANPAAEVIFSKTPGKLIGEKLECPARAGEVFNLKVHDKAGVERIVELRMVEIEWEGELALLTHLRDITESKREEKALKEISEMKSDFVSTASHELRTPLAVIRESVSIVLDEISGKVNQKQKRLLSIAVNNISRLTRLIDNLLDISKIESHSNLLVLKTMDIIKVAKEIVKEWDGEALEKNIKLTLAQYPKKPLWVKADPDKLIQIFDNLISNALKFTRNRGKITINVFDKENEAEVEIIDTGCGIAPSDMPKLFEKFEQLNHDPETGNKGTGLGLAITKGLLAKHGGRIGVESKLGQGTKFTFILPKAAQKT